MNENRRAGAYNSSVKNIVERMSLMRLKSNGFTLIELVIIIAILGILAGIAVFKLASTNQDAAKNVCYTNRSILARFYQFKLAQGYSMDLQSFVDNPENYGQSFGIKPVCPYQGIYTVTNGKIGCSYEGHNADVVESGSTTSALTSNSLISTLKALSNLNIYENGIKLNGELKAALGGSFLAVEDNIVKMAFDNSYNGGILYWHTDTASSANQILFAGDASSDHSNWAAYLVIVNGVLYKSKLTNSNGSIKAANIAQMYQLSGTSLQARLDSNFTMVGKID